MLEYSILPEAHTLQYPPTVQHTAWYSNARLLRHNVPRGQTCTGAIQTTYCRWFLRQMTSKHSAQRSSHLSIPLFDRVQSALPRQVKHEENSHSVVAHLSEQGRTPHERHRITALQATTAGEVDKQAAFVMKVEVSE